MMTEREKELLTKIIAKTIVTFGGILTAAWIIYYLYDLLWRR
tara:strand:- start:2999 stop:3124 length:126 start_codon:yes stop_codon:yes gene_type:complete